MSDQSNAQKVQTVQSLTFVGAEINYLDQLIGELPTKYGKSFLEFIGAVQRKRQQEHEQWLAAQPKNSGEGEKSPLATGSTKRRTIRKAANPAEAGGSNDQA
jgi:hypothetical protein